MAYSEDDIALAAEYALGTLDRAERDRVEAMMAADSDYAGVVRSWELRLGALNQMVGLVEPRPEVWERIKAAIAAAAPPASVPVAPPALPESPPATEPEIIPAEAVAEAVAPPDAGVVDTVTTVTAASVTPDAPASETAASGAPSPPPLPAAPVIAPPSREAVATERPARAEDANVIRLSAKVRQLRTVANAMTAIAAMLLALLSVQVWRPDLLPQALRLQPRTEVADVKGPGGVAPAQYVALLQKDAASPAFILTVDAATKNFTVRRVGAEPEQGKSFELWIVSDKLQRPRSLGVIGGSDFTTRQALSSYDSDLVNRATYAVTVEPEGGSPTGVATGPIVFKGQLIETVPPAPR